MVDDGAGGGADAGGQAGDGTGRSGPAFGVVKDAQGGVVPGVVVQVTNEKTGQTREVVTSAEGLYMIANLPASTYKVKAQLSGFAVSELAGVQVLPRPGADGPHRF